jgi:hypothetical protein
MSIGSLVSSILWEEVEAPAARTTHAPTGAPASLRGAVRFVVIGFSAMMLTAQVAGIRLAAPVDADPSYCVVQSQQCKDACPRGAVNAACVQECNEQRKRCDREEA